MQYGEWGWGRVSLGFAIAFACSLVVPVHFRAPNPEKLGPEVIGYYLILAVGLIGLLFIG